jgi:phage terminase large subunit
VNAAARQIKLWRENPARMVWDLFGETPDAWQADGLREFADPTKQRQAFQACAGPGKTAVLAWMGWNFLLCYGDVGQHPNGAVMSVTADNLKNNLWKELAVWRSRSELLRDTFEMTAERIFAREHPQTWFLSARSWSKTANPDEQGRTLSGLHSKFILYLIDESGDIGPSVLRAAEQGLSNCTWGKIIIAGNPTSQSGLLYQAVAEQSHLWDVIRVTGDPLEPKRSPRIGLEWASEQIRLYGRDNPWVMAYILGQFPPSSLNALLGPDDVRSAMGRHLTQDKYEYSQKRLGIDVARFGDDATVIFPRQGLAAFGPVEMRNARTNEIAARVAQAKQKWESELELIDDTGGWGAGVIDQARLGGINLLPINFSGKADDPRYYNKRSEMIFRASEWVKAGGCLPEVPGLVSEAVAPTYWFDNGKLRVTEKDQIKKELGKSPDYWDAFCLTFALVEMPSRSSPQMIAAGIQGSRIKDDWDPWSSDR